MQARVGVMVGGSSARIASGAATAMIQRHNPTPQAAHN
jgi:hypothetical protein